MKQRTLLLFTLVIISSTCFAQNVGIGTTTPAEKLDVSGNINVTGTIKTNGIDGSAGQILMKNESGSLTWGDFTEFKNRITFQSGAATWTVPAGVTKILVECWGGGAGGNFYSGGGGGAYMAGKFVVTPGELVGYTVGTGSNGNADNSVNAGYSQIVCGSVVLTAFGGSGATATSGPPVIVGGAVGGGYSFTGTLSNYIGRDGKPGQMSTSYTMQFPSILYEFCTGGRGGDAGNTVNTGGGSNIGVINVTSNTVARYSNSLANGTTPGGGGGSGVRPVAGALALSGSFGANGLVIIHY